MSGPERKIDDRLADWVDGTLSARERERVVAELRVSPQLRQDLADYEKTVAVVRAALQAPTVPSQLADRVMAAIAAEQQARPVAAARWRLRPVALWPLAWSLASAAAVLCCALLVNAWSRTPVTNLSVDLSAVDNGAVAPSAEPDSVWDKLAAGEPGTRDREQSGPAGAAKNDSAAGKDDTSMLPGGGVPRQERLDERKSRQPGESLQPVGEESKSVRAIVPTPADAPPGSGDKAKVEANPSKAPAPEAAAERAPTPSNPSTGGPVTAAELDRGAVGDRTADALKDGPGTKPSTYGFPAPGAPMPTLTEKTESENSAGKSRIEDRVSAEELLPLVVLQGDPIDVSAEADREAVALRTQQAPAVDPTPPAVAGGQGSAAQRQEFLVRLDAFFASQMRFAEPVDDVVAPSAASSSSLRFRVLRSSAAELRSGATGGAKASPPVAARVASGPPAAASEPVERTWLVEGTKADLAVLLGRLSAFARSGNLLLTTGETQPVLAAASNPVASTPDGQVAPKVADRQLEKDVATPAGSEPDRTRLVLRFRVLRR